MHVETTPSDEDEHRMSGTVANPIGITNPPIDDLLQAADSKYALVIYSAKRARQINAYYSQLQEGLLDYVGPLVETEISEKPLSIALREINEGLADRRGRSRGVTATQRSRRPEHPHAAVVLGVGGGIAAYKAALLLRLLTESGHDVTVVPTAAALRFVGAPTWEALSGKPVSTEVWSDVPRVPHVRIGKKADLVVVAPATADLLARAAAGLADDLLTTTLLTARCPVVFAPAMHTEMWEHPATQANVATLALARRAHRPAGLRPAHRRGHRPGPAARARGDLRRLPAPRSPRCRSRADRGRHRCDLGAAGRRQRRRHARAARPGALPRQPVLGQAGLCAGAGRRGPRRRR